jgi:Ca2+-binding EF-hand superfamily protein
MTKTPWIVGAALASALALTGLAHAMPGGDEGRMGPPKTRAELQAMIAGHFKAADADKDGIVTRAEADAAREAMKAKYSERRAEMREHHFAMLDTDKNGQLSKEEFTAPREHGGKDGKHAGRGHEGHGDKMGHHGWRGHHGGAGGMGFAMRGQWFERADANKDGKLTLAETEARPLEMFDKVDTNKDGTISREEHQAARTMMRAKWKEMRGQADKG